MALAFFSFAAYCLLGGELLTCTIGIILTLARCVEQFVRANSGTRPLAVVITTLTSMVVHWRLLRDGLSRLQLLPDELRRPNEDSYYESEQSRLAGFLYRRRMLLLCWCQLVSTVTYTAVQVRNWKMNGKDNAEIDDCLAYCCIAVVEIVVLVLFEFRGQPKFLPNKRFIFITITTGVYIFNGYKLNGPMDNLITFALVYSFS